MRSLKSVLLLGAGVAAYSALFLIAPTAAADQQRQCTTATVTSDCPSFRMGDVTRRSDSKRVLGRGVRNVAVFDDESVGTALGLASVLNTQPKTQAVAVDRATVESGGLERFDCVIARLFAGEDGDAPTVATVQAIRTFVGNGGGYVGEWQGAAAAVSGPTTSVDGDYYLPSRYLQLFAGRASDGGPVEDGTVTVASGHAVVRGLGTSFTGDGGTEFFVRTVGLDKQLKVIATYQGHGGINPAIAVGHIKSAHTVLIFFDAIDEPSNPSLQRLWHNSVQFACPPRGK
jgi:hypothetical protein